jgi:hypothetical protein
LSWYPDLGTTTMAASGPHVRAVGWLARAKPFVRNPATSALVGRLRDYCELHARHASSIVWQAAIWNGGHACELCGSGWSTACIAVPSKSALYVAPDLIVHYVETHEYAPPAEFVQALTESPLPGTAGYDSAVLTFFDGEHARRVAEERARMGIEPPAARK